MMRKESAEYQETDLEVQEVADAALSYIMTGDEIGRPYDLRGLGVFGVIGMLRENDELFQDGLTIDQEQRVAQIESDVDAAVRRNAQYYPFGHNDNARFSANGCVGGL